MRGHDQTSRRVRSRAWSGLILAALAVAPAMASGEERPDTHTTLPSAADPIDLGGRRVQTWNEGTVEWVHLEGRASVFQGVEGVRVEEALVRITSTRNPGGTRHTVEVYGELAAERSARRSPPARRSVHTVFVTDQVVRSRSHGPRGIERLATRPIRLSILTRSGFEPSDPRTVHQVPEPPTLVRGQSPGGVPEPEPEPPAQEVDRALRPTQFPGDDDAGAFPLADPALPPLVETPRGEADPSVPPDLPLPDLQPLPGPDGMPAPPLRGDRPAEATPRGPVLPVMPGTQRVTRIYPRSGGPFEVQRLPLADGVETIIVQGGVNIVTESPQFGIVDLSADSAVIWRRLGPDGKGSTTGPNGEQIDDARQPLEIYLEGDVVVRQDERKVAGDGDRKTFRAERAYYEVQSERFVGLNAEIDMFAPGLVSPARITSPRIEQFRPFEPGPNGTGRFGLAEIRADQIMGTGSRFPKPGYRFTAGSVDLYRIPTNEVDPNSGRQLGDPRDPNAPTDLTWKLDSRQNIFWLGPLPVFYWPRFVAEADDLEPPLRQLTFRTNNVFGQQLLSDWNGFRTFGLRKPLFIDTWNLDVDYLSYRTKNFPALGSEIGWFGRDLLNDLGDPYGKVRGKAPSFTSDYFGYFDVWGLKDAGTDILGSGPAVITNNRNAGNVGYQRGGGGRLGSVPPFQDYRGRFVLRHMQRFIPDDEEHLYEDFRGQFEAAYVSDRYFLEEYYKRLFDVGMDQETLVYLIRQKRNWAWTLWAEANLQDWYTDTQWLPRLDYYRLGDSFLNNWFTYFGHSGLNYANTHTDVMVNNPYIFAFTPYDPVSNTTGVLEAFRAYTAHELDMPLNLGDVLRVTPYVQGQAVGWSNQIDGNSIGRLWGAAGVRASAMAWRAFPEAQSELLNVHGLNHKVNFFADYRNAWSNEDLNSIGVQDDLDDNTYEFVRRYFALTNYAGGLLPDQYDPRFLTLRRGISPITGTTDVQASLNSLRLGLHQRLQTKRGPEGKRRIVDWMTFDLDTTYFPQPSRDNFGKSFGQNMYNWQWFLGDRTSLVSYGWFEFWDINGRPIYNTNIARHNDPFGLNVITSGVSLSRPPRGNVFLGYSVIDTGPLSTSALNVSTSYWLSPKWYGTYSTMYDFGNAILLNAMFSLTRIGADYLTSVGLTVDPQRQSYMFALQVSPRLAPNVRLGSGVGLTGFDSRYAPTQ
ncbi:MAG: hypothetical protein AB7I30_13935 [Isosphaeraceae bacterium]